MKGTLSWKDWAIALVTGLSVVGLLCLFPYPWLHPVVWDDAAAAAGLRMPSAILPGLGRAVMLFVYEDLGPVRAQTVLLWGGRVAAGVIALFAWMLFNESLPDLLRRRMRLVGWGREVVRRILVLGVFFFMCNEAVWRAGQTLSVTTVHLFLALPAIWCVVRFLISESLWCVYASMALWGILAGDTPFGGIGGIISAGIIWWKSFKVEDMTVNPIGNPLVRSSIQRRMMVVFFVMALAVVGLNIFTYLHCNGIFGGEDVALPDSQHVDASALDIMLTYFSEYCRAIIGTMSGLGWLFTFVLAVAPLIIAYICIGSAILDDKFIPFRYGALFLGMGIIAWTQSCGFSSLWFRSWFSSAVSIKSELAIALNGLMNALTLVWSLSVLGVDVYFRDFRRISQYRFQDAAETAVGEREVLTIVKFNRLIQILVWLLPVLLVLSVVPMRRQLLVRRMAECVYDYCRETVRECGNARWVFTDGTLDAAIELLAQIDGKKIFCANMMGSGSVRDVALRLRGVLDDEDRTSLETGAPDTLRTWVFDKPARHPQIAVQIGFELWKKNRDAKPPVYAGVVVRPSGMSPEVVDDAIENTHKLEERILDLYYRVGDPSTVSDHRIRDLFMLVQWRLARMSRLRSNEYAVLKRMNIAEKDNLLAIELDANNSSIARIKKSMEWITAQRGTRLTPREGLKIALDRADFKMAELFAQNILRADPDDVSANFALGMNCFFEEQYGRASEYLRRVLIRKPNEPSVLSNLCVIMMRMDRYDEAVEFAERAAKAAPKSQEIKRTLAKAKKLRDDAARKKRLLNK